MKRRRNHDEPKNSTGSNRRGIVDAVAAAFPDASGQWTGEDIARARVIEYAVLALTAPDGIGRLVPTLERIEAPEQLALVHTNYGAKLARRGRTACGSPCLPWE